MSPVPTRNRPQAKFCEECASPLTRSCAKCGNPLPPTAKLLPECANPVGGEGATPSRFPSPETYTPKHLAEKIVTSRTSLEGERKQVTVLFADMKGSTELLADRDPEDARTLLDPVLTLLKAYFRVQERDEQRRIREKVTGKLLTLDEGFRSLLPALLALLEMSSPSASRVWQTTSPATSFEMSALPAVACGSVAAHCLSDLGRFGAARAMADEAVRIAEASGHAYSIAWACQAAALARVGQGAGAEAARWAERSLDIARRDGLGNFISLATTALGRAYAFLGRASEGAKLLEQMTVQHHAGARLSHAVGLSRRTSSARARPRRCLARKERSRSAVARRRARSRRRRCASLARPAPQRRLSTARRRNRSSPKPSPSPSSWECDRSPRSVTLGSACSIAEPERHHAPATIWRPRSRCCARWRCGSGWSGRRP